MRPNATTKQIPILILLLLAIAILIFYTCAARILAYSDPDPYTIDNRNLIGDPSLENLPGGWSLSDSWPAGCSEDKFVSDSVHSGDKSFKVVCQGTSEPAAPTRHNFYHVSQTISLKPSTRYILTHWARTEG